MSDPAPRSPNPVLDYTRLGRCVSCDCSLADVERIWIGPILSVLACSEECLRFYREDFRPLAASDLDSRGLLLFPSVLRVRASGKFCTIDGIEYRSDAMLLLRVQDSTGARWLWDVSDLDVCLKEGRG